MKFKPNTYLNSTELANLNGIPIYMHDIVDAALRGKLNTFLQGDTGFGKTQLGRDVMNYFEKKSLFILGRNDMNTRDLFQRVNPEFLKALKGQGDSNAQFKELTDKINYNLICVDELPNCVPSVRSQLFNLFDGFIEIDGKAYAIGGDYCVGIATGNIGQEFTESANELGRALRDRMHLLIDTDYFKLQPIDTWDMLKANQNPRVCFSEECLEDRTQDIINAHNELKKRDVPLEKYIIGLYLVHGLDYLDGGITKTELKSGWPNKLEGHEAGSDAALIKPISPRAVKSVIRLSQALDMITEEKGAEELNYFNSMMIAFKFTSACSGILNQALVRENYSENPYKAMDAVIATTMEQFNAKKENIAASIWIARKGKTNKNLSDEFSGRWGFMKGLLENLAKRHEK